MECRELQYVPTEASFIAELSIKDVQKAFDEGWFDFEPRGASPNRSRRSLGLAELLHLRIIKNTCRDVVLPTETKKQVHRQLQHRLSHLFIALATVGDLVRLTESAKEPRRELFREHFGRTLNSLVPLSRHENLVLLPLICSQSLESDRTSACLFDEELSKAALYNFRFNNLKRRILSESDQCRTSFRSMGSLFKEPLRISYISIDASHAWEEIAERLAVTTAARLAVVSDPEIRSGEPVVRGTRIPVHLLQALTEQGATHKELLDDYPSLDAERLKLALLYAKMHPRPGRPKKSPWRQIAGRDE